MKKVASLCILLILAGCGSSGAPKCSDSAVKKLVIDIATDEMKNQLTSQGIMKRGVNPQAWGYPTYEVLKQQMAGREDIKSIIESVDNQLNSVTMSLEGIRTNGADNKIKKCQCGANLAFSNGNSLPIEYSAQYTEDGKVYAEVSGLK